ncbi:RNA-directed DNA polymerase [Abeliophyllum distichum]|uniref:RNA-directed DNA polymerase n=1 Tax=Abeliophyllum distichum TaxID=126358 RepID=A0ABD1PES7_9LAMI
MFEDNDVPLILGRPFLATSQIVIDVKKEELMLKVNDEHITLNVFKAITFPSSPDSCFEIDAIDQEGTNTFTLKNQLDQKKHIPIKKPRSEENLFVEESEIFLVEFEYGGKTKSYQYDKGKIKLWKVNKNCGEVDQSKKSKSSKDLFKVS